MSHSSPSGQHPKTSSPQSIQSSTGYGQSNPSSRPGTSGASQAEYRHTYPPIAPLSNPLGRQHGVPRPSYGLPPEATTTPSRALGMQSILNPTENTQPDLHSAVPFQNQTPLLPPTTSPRSRKRPVPGSPLREQQAPPQHTGGRRVLTPRSPGLRASSIGARRAPTFHGPAASLQSLMGPEPRIYTAEPGSSDIPSLPSLAAAARGSALGLHATELPPFQARPPATQSTAALRGATPHSDSPSTSHTSLSQHDQTSPAFRYGTMPSVPHAQGANRMRPGPMASDFMSEGLHHGPSEGYQSGQRAYQMTLETEQGPMVVPVELDLQQASKVADEKRKRNAGASARFRARRKEKEKEASSRISELQQEIRSLREDRDFYRNERNVMRDFAASRLGPTQIPPRPPSPLTRRPVDMSRHVELEESGRERSESAPATQRRRTGDYAGTFVAPGPSPSQPFPGTYPPPPAQQGQPLAPPPPLPQQTGPYASPRPLPPGPTGPHGAPPLGPRSQSYDPFRKDPYDRSWNPGR